MVILSLQAIYSLRQDIAAVTGMRAGFEEYVIEWGPLGNNGKGQKRALRECVMGLADRLTGGGYVAVVSSSLLKDTGDEIKPNEDLVKLDGSREAVIDDFGSKAKALSCETIKNYTGGNTITGHGKHEKSRNMSTDFLLRLITNEFPRFSNDFGEADLRRLAVIFYPCSFKSPADYDEANPNHRKLVDYKDRVPEFAAYFVEWCRLLAGCTKAGRLKTLWPRPASMAQVINEQFQSGQEESIGEKMKKFISTSLTKCAVGELPDSRDAIIKHAASLLNLPYAACQTELRNQLVWHEKPFMTRVAGQVKKIHCFAFSAALKLEVLAKLKVVAQGP